MGEQLTRKENLESYLAAEEFDRQDPHQEEPYNGDSDTDKSDRTPLSSDVENQPVLRKIWILLKEADPRQDHQIRVNPFLKNW